MRRVMYLYLPSWPIDRLRRSGCLTNLDAAPADAPPFATVVETSGRRLLAAVNPAAAASGLAPGMPLADALSFLPGLLTVAAAPEADAAALGRLAEWCRRYSPWAAPDGTDGIKIEITGCAHLWGGEAELVADLTRRLARQTIEHRTAVAGTLGAAWALARFAADGDRPALAAPGGQHAMLAPLPVEALRLDPATAAGLRRVGLRHVGELHAMPRDALARRFGEQVRRRLDQALGDLPEPLSPLGEAPVRRVRLSFAEPIADPADLIRAIERLVGDLAARLAREGSGARRLDLAFNRVDGRVEHIRLGTARPSRDPKHLAGLLTAKLLTIEPGLGVEDMILALYAAEPLPAEQVRMPSVRPPKISLSPPSGERGRDGELRNGPPHPALSPRRGERGFLGGGGGRGKNCLAAEDLAAVAPLLDRLGARLGLDAIGRIASHASHIPERAALYAPLGEHPNSNSDVVPGHRTAAQNAAKPPRPVRLFTPPEPVEAVWLLPDDPPFHFTWRRRLHRVRQADGPERVAEEWWTTDAAMTAEAIRDYYRVEDEAGRRFWLFRAGLPGDPPPRWYMHGLFA